MNSDKNETSRYAYGFNGTQEQLLRALRFHPARESRSSLETKEAAAHEIERLQRIAEAATEFVRDSYRPSPKCDGERFDKLAIALVGGEDAWQQ